MIFFTSDTHFNHARILELGEGRPFKDINHHNEMLILNWNSVVGQDDIVYHLGDVALGPWPTGLDMVARLNGFIALVPGNHDRVSSLESVTRRERFMPDYLNVFDAIYPEVINMALGGHHLTLSHYPYDGDSHKDAVDRHQHLRAVDNGVTLIHGHTHSPNVVSYSKRGTLQISVGVDSNNWTPVSLDQIVDTIKSVSG